MRRCFAKKGLTEEIFLIGVDGKRLHGQDLREKKKAIQIAHDKLGHLKNAPYAAYIDSIEGEDYFEVYCPVCGEKDILTAKEIEEHSCNK